MQDLLAAVYHYATPAGMRINVSKTKVMSALIPDEQRQAVVPEGELSIQVPRLNVHRKLSGHRRDQKQDKSCQFRILRPAILSLIAAYKKTELTKQ